MPIDQRLNETEAEVRSLAAGMLSDFFKQVVVPRYGATTKDGVKLGPTFWAELTGMTAKAIEGRVARLRRSGAVSDPSLALPASSVRAAKSVLSRSTVAEVQDMMKDSKVAKVLTDAVLRNTGQTRTHAPVSDEGRYLDVENLLLRAQKACRELQKHLNDYVPNDELGETALTTGRQLDMTAKFVKMWAKGQDVGDEAEAFLRSLA